MASKGWAATVKTGTALLLAQNVHRAMFWTSMRSLLLFALSLAAVTWAGLAWIRSETSQPPQAADRGRSPEPTTGSRNHLAQAQTVTATSTRNDDSLTFAGRVLDPDRKPRQGASVASHGTGSTPVTADILLSPGVQLRGRVTDSATGKPMRAKVAYVPLRANPQGPEIMEPGAAGQDVDDRGHFALTGVPGQGVLLVTARRDDAVFFPMLQGVTREDRRRGIALADDEYVLDALPRPVSVVGSHAYKVIDVPQGQRDLEVNFDLTLHQGRTISVRVVDAKGEALRGVTAFGLRNPTANAAEIMRGDESFAVHDVDPGWPRRVFFYQPDRDLAAFLDLAGNEPDDVTARLSTCGSIVGRVVDRAGMPLPGAHFGLVYDDVRGVPHIAFPNGRWVPTGNETVRDRRTRDDFVPPSPINIAETSDKDGRFQIRHVVPGRDATFTSIIDNASRQLGLKAPPHEGKKLVHEGAVSAGQVVDVGDIRIRPEELRGKRRAR